MKGNFYYSAVAGGRFNRESFVWKLYQEMGIKICLVLFDPITRTTPNPGQQHGQ